MATRIGTTATGTADPATASIATAAKNTAGANNITGWAKWEAGPTVTSITDTAGNTYSFTQLAHSLSEPHVAVFWTTGTFTSNASNVVTVNFSAATATFRRAGQDAWSGLGTAVQDTKSNEGTASPYSTGAMTLSSAGLVYAAWGDFNALAGLAATGTPASTLAAQISDNFGTFVASAAAGTATPGATTTSGTTRWVGVSKAFTDPVPTANRGLPDGIYHTMKYGAGGLRK